MSRPVQSPAGIKRLEQNARRLRLWFSSWIYEVTGPRYALCCFVTHVETKSPPVSLPERFFEFLWLAKTPATKQQSTALQSLSHIGESGTNSSAVAELRLFVRRRIEVAGLFGGFLLPGAVLLVFRHGQHAADDAESAAVGHAVDFARSDAEMCRFIFD